MTAKKYTQHSSKKIHHDLASWNFIIFLTLAFILLVVVLNAVNNVSYDLRSRAGKQCPEISLPRAEDCAGGWSFRRGADGCVAFYCDAGANLTPTVKPLPTKFPGKKPIPINPKQE